MLGSNLTQGKKVVEFERQLALYTGCNESVVVNSGTSALHIACLAIGVGKGDLVWTSPITFVASINCAMYCGANIDFVDIEEESGNICAVKLESKLKDSVENRCLPKLLIVVHLAGASCEMMKISALCKQYGVKLIEDASHAVGGKFRGYKVGSCKYSDMTVFSFHPVKVITTGEGGAVLTNERESASLMRNMRSLGIERSRNNWVEYHGEADWYHEQQHLGYNYRLTDIQCTLGIRQLKRVEKFVGERRDIYERYIDALRDERLIKVIKERDGVESACHLVIIKLQGQLAKERDKLFMHMRKNGIGVQLHYRAVYRHPLIRNYPGYKFRELRCAEDFWRSTMSLPVYPGLKKQDQKRVLRVLREGVRCLRG